MHRLEGELRAAVHRQHPHARARPPAQSRPRELCDEPERAVDDEARGGSQVSVYSGPEPPSGGVRRPPFAVMAPHWTQFDGVTCTTPSTTSYTCAGQSISHIRPTSVGTSVCTRMWLGWSSRVLFPDAKTDESLSNVSLPSGLG